MTPAKLNCMLAQNCVCACVHAYTCVCVCVCVRLCLESVAVLTCSVLSEALNTHTHIQTQHTTYHCFNRFRKKSPDTTIRVFFHFKGFCNLLKLPYDTGMFNRGHYVHMIHEKNETSVYANEKRKKKPTLSEAATHIEDQGKCMAACVFTIGLSWLMSIVTWPVKCMAMPGQTCPLISYWSQMTGEDKHEAESAAL